MRESTALLTILLTLFPAREAGVANEWEQKLPEKEERCYRELEAKRSKEIAKGGKLQPWEEDEFQALDKKKYPYGHSPHTTPGPPDDDLVYEPTPKHRRGGWGTYMDLDDLTAQEVLRESIPGGKKKQRYGYHDGKLYEFQPNNVGEWHGYPVPGNEVPTKVLREMKDRGIISKSEYNKMAEGRS